MAVRSPVQTMENTAWKILIIEDDEDDFLIARDMLKEAKGRKFDTHWANSYAAGKDDLISNHHNAVLVDYDLGMYSGIDLIREVSEPGYASPLILFTGRGNYEVDVEAMGAGATMYLTKGEVNPLLLERAIRYAIEIKQRENELREARETAERELAERKRAEEALRKSEAKLRAVFEALVEGVVFLDPDGRVIEANSAILRYGNTLSELTDPELDPRYRMIHPDGSPFPEQDQPAILAMRTGQAVRDVELGILQPDGSIVWWLVNAQPVYDENGVLQGAVTSFFNITERRLVEKALKESENRYRDLFTSMNETTVLAELI